MSHHTLALEMSGVKSYVYRYLVFGAHTLMCKEMKNGLIYDISLKFI